jgi:hypothetical protein
MAFLLAAIACRPTSPRPELTASASASASAPVPCALDATEEVLVRELPPLESSARPSPRDVERELALAALYRRRGCREELATTLQRLDPALMQMEPETWVRWADLVMPSRPERVLGSLERRAADAPYPTQTALALRHLLGSVDWGRPSEVGLVEAACRALLGRDPGLSALYSPPAAFRRPSRAELGALIQNSEPLTLLGSVAIAAAKCEKTRELARAALGVLRLAHPRLVPKTVIALPGLKQAAFVITDLLGPDREKVATDIALAEYLLEPSACKKSWASWRRLGFSPVSFAAYLGSLPGEAPALRDCVALSAFAAPKDSAEAQRLLANLAPIARAMPEVGAGLADLGWAALRRTRTAEVTIDLALAELVATELGLAEQGFARPSPCALLTTELDAPAATVTQWRRLAAAEAIRACPAPAKALLDGAKTEPLLPEFLELVRRIAKRDRGRAASMSLERLGGTPAERAEVAVGVVYALSRDLPASRPAAPASSSSGR